MVDITPSAHRPCTNNAIGHKRNTESEKKFTLSGLLIYYSAQRFTTVIITRTFLNRLNLRVQVPEPHLEADAACAAAGAHVETVDRRRWHGERRVGQLGEPRWPHG